MNDKNNGKSQAFMGMGCLCILIAAVLGFLGPKDEAGHLFWWWHLIILSGVLLWWIGQKIKIPTGAPGKTIESTRAALDAALTAGDTEMEAKAHLDLGIAYQTSYETPRREQVPDYTPLEQAIKHISHAHDLYGKLGNKDERGFALSNLGVIHYAKHQDEKAASYFRAALQIAKKLSFPDWEYQTIQRFTRLLGEMGRLSESHEVMKEYSIRKATKS